MTEFIRKKLNESKAARWTVLITVAFTMFCAYFLNDVMAPLMEKLGEEFGWTAQDFGTFNFSYGWINVFLFMLIFGGMILDKIGVRMTGIGSCICMVIGAAIQYYSVGNFVTFEGAVFGIKMQLFVACVGFAIFAFGLEMAGITVTKTIVRWFKGYEIALAMGLQVAIARLGMGLAYALTLPLANRLGLSTPILVGLLALCIGLIAYLAFCVMDKKLDKSVGAVEVSEEDKFKFSDILFIIKNKGFWLITFLCLLFYSAVFPFMKYAVSFMKNKYHIDDDFAGIIPFMLPVGAIFLTPFFGGIYDKKGKGATIMIVGAVLLICVHFLFSLPMLDHWLIAGTLMVVLGIAFSLVPSAMWPSVPKIIPENKLGTAYGLIFWVQNIGLSGVPYLIGWVLYKYCITGTNTVTEIVDGLEKTKEVTLYDYTIPMIIFAGFGVASLIIAFLLKREDRLKGYGLEKPNVVKE
ncbi:MFS transporter [Dysgonomonas sp. 25]|uniref:MFS transporter n=1 Tax=Dysgonomonas sp. 25 TaxID=2302933 RepID=UPI0013D47BFD|nr:MFS transporter [Dysgonomonas sp. 25]NDV69900.1 MFS transporter [Dysgonomonas sp. 25]